MEILDLVADLYDTPAKMANPANPQQGRGVHDDEPVAKNGESDPHSPNSPSIRHPENGVNKPNSPLSPHSPHSPTPDGETLTHDESEASRYMAAVAVLREKGIRPPTYTAQTVCRGCGYVWIFANAPPHVDLCPWDGPRLRGVEIPRPEVQCKDCQRFTPDPVGNGGTGKCDGYESKPGVMPPYPNARRQCAHFLPNLAHSENHHQNPNARPRASQSV